MTSVPPRVPTAKNLGQKTTPTPAYHRYPLRSRLTLASNTSSFAPQYAAAVAHIESTKIIRTTQDTDLLMNSVVNKDMVISMDYRALSRGTYKEVWVRSFVNDLVRLAQGIGTKMPTGTSTLFFIPLDEILTNKNVTYGKFVATIRPTKTEINRVRLTVDGYRLEYVGDITTQCTSLTSTKLLLNSVLSTARDKCMTIDLKDFYYNTPMRDYEYMQLPLAIIPQEIIDQYQLQNIQRKDIVYMEICTEMPGLEQAGKLAKKFLQSHLLKYGYSPVPRIMSL